jgi:hypothetical protein
MLEQKILKILKPTIAIDQMDMMNTDDPNSPLQSGTNKHKIAGAIYPLIQINKHQFDEQEVVSLTLDETGFIPTIRVMVESSDGLFISKYFPKDGDPMSIWIRSKMDEFTPIRCDFEITNVNALPSVDSSGDVQSFTIEGILRVPGMYAEWCKSFGVNTSYDTLKKVAEELKIGFASNEVSTNDKMRWICPFDNYEAFIKDITSGSYKDDDSFFTTFIDKYYNLNFVNMNNQFSEEFNVDEALEALNFSDDFFKGKDKQTFQTQLYLCNHRNLRGTGSYIQGYTLVNTAGRKIMDDGYRRYVQYYDPKVSNTPAEKYQTYFIEPLNTKGTKDKILMKGRIGENFFDKHHKHKWLGIQLNSHENYMHALIQNWQNSQQIDKMKMRINLAKCNFNLYRGQRIPILIVNDGDTKRQKSTLTEGQSENDQISYDKFLTGYYMITGTIYSWNSDYPVFSQELILSRREWPIPVLAA